MSRVAKAPVVVPAGVDVKINGQVITIKGKNGELTRTLNDAVEVKHYPSVGPARKVSIGETIRESLKFLGLMITVNLLAFAIYLFFPLAFWIVNGVMLGREYFQMVAMRRVGRKEAKLLRRSHWLQISVAGTLMAVPLTVPLLNLIIPILGVAMFTHLFHRLVAT